MIVSSEKCADDALQFKIVVKSNLLRLDSTRLILLILSFTTFSTLTIASFQRVTLRLWTVLSKTQKLYSGSFPRVRQILLHGLKGRLELRVRF